MQIVIYTLLNYINCCIKQDTNYDIAKCLLLNIRKLSKMSLDDMALLCGVSVSTLNRFFRTVGFNNSSTVRKLLKNHDLPFNYESFIDHHEQSQEYVEKMMQGLSQIENIPSNEFIYIAKMIERANRIYLIGYGDFHYQAGYFQNVMLYHGKLLEILQQNSRLSTINVQENDLIIITSLTGGYVKNMYDKIKNLKCKKVVISQTNDESFKIFDSVLEMGKVDDRNINKYLTMRIYEKIISSYYFYKNGQNLTNKNE